MGTRKIFDIGTGQTTEVPFTTEEQAAADAAAVAKQPVIAQRTADQQAVAAAKADATVQYLVNHTPQECYDYVQANVTTLAQAKVMMGRLAMAMSAIARNKLR